MRRLPSIILIIMIIAPLAVGLASCRDATPANASTPRPDGPWTITCTVGMVADIVRNIAGEHATVTNIIGEGVDPHLYKPTRSDIAQLLAADAVFYSGLLLEGKMTDALVRVGRAGKPVFAVTELIDPEYLLEPPGFAGHADPHVWMDVAGWIQATEAATEALCEFDPAHAADYRQRKDEYAKSLLALDVYATRTIASIPADRRVLVTAHDAFNYFGRAYEIEVLGIQGISTESEAGLDDLNQLIDLIVKRDIGAVFVETSVADKNVQALIEGAGSRGKHVIIGGSLYSDAMGAPGTYEGTYIGMIDHNATTIARALGGEAPAGGMLGQLGQLGMGDER